jgi:hypothetical protein
VLRGERRALARGTRGLRYGCAALLGRLLLLLLVGACLSAPLLAVQDAPAQAIDVAGGPMSTSTTAGTAQGAGGAGSDNPADDQGSSSNYRSNITSVTPDVRGLSVQVLEFADRLVLTNRTGETVTVYGYDGEPYARVLADGTVQRNVLSPATYLNASFYGDINVPAIADAHAPPRWEVLDRTGQLEWHDHRIHYTSPAVPPQVTDRGRRTLIFDWKVPIRVGAQAGAIDGQLFWTPEKSSAPVAVIVLGVAIVVAGIAFAVVVRRRRARDAHAGSGSAAADGPSPPPQGASEEAW